MSKERTNIKNLKYREIALDYIANNFNDIRGIYKKYYPDLKVDSYDVLPYRLLDNIRFQKILETLLQGIDIEKVDIAKEVLLTLYTLMKTSQKNSDKINSAIWLGKTKALYIDKSETKLNISEEKRIDLLRLSEKLSIRSEN